MSNCISRRIDFSWNETNHIRYRVGSYDRKCHQTSQITFKFIPFLCIQMAWDVIWIKALATQHPPIELNWKCMECVIGYKSKQPTHKMLSTTHRIRFIRLMCVFVCGYLCMMFIKQLGFTQNVTITSLDYDAQWHFVNLRWILRGTKWIDAPCSITKYQNLFIPFDMLFVVFVGFRKPFKTMQPPHFTHWMENQYQ